MSWPRAKRDLLPLTCGIASPLTATSAAHLRGPRVPHTPCRGQHHSVDVARRGRGAVPHDSVSGGAGRAESVPGRRPDATALHVDALAAVTAPAVLREDERTSRHHATGRGDVAEVG